MNIEKIRLLLNLILSKIFTYFSLIEIIKIFKILIIAKHVLVLTCEFFFQRKNDKFLKNAMIFTLIPGILYFSLFAWYFKTSQERIFKIIKVANKKLHKKMS